MLRRLRDRFRRWCVTPSEYERNLNQMYEAGYAHASDRARQEIAVREAHAEARGYWRAVDEIFKFTRSEKADQRPSIH